MPRKVALQLPSDLLPAIAQAALAAEDGSAQAWARLSLVCREVREALRGEVLIALLHVGLMPAQSFMQQCDMRAPECCT
jgi:hypothetical protein